MIPLKATVKVIEQVKVDPKKNEAHAIANAEQMEFVSESVEKDCFCEDVLSAIDIVDGKAVTNIYARVLMRTDGGYVPFVTDYSNVIIDVKEVEEYVRLSWQNLNK